MPQAKQHARMYEDLAYVCDRQGQAKLRDWFLLLAADVAWATGNGQAAERLREQLLSFNPHHLLGAFPSFGEALISPDVQSYLNDLRQTYPPQTAGDMLENGQTGDLVTERGQMDATAFLDDDAESQYDALEQEAENYFLHEDDEYSGNAVPEPKPASETHRPIRQSAPFAPSPIQSPTRRAKARPRKPSPLVMSSNGSPNYPDAPPRTDSEFDSDESEHLIAASSWVADLLFLSILLAGLLLAFYVFAAPFLRRTGLFGGIL